MSKFVRIACIGAAMSAAMCASAQTPADQVINLDTAITIQSKLRQLNDLMGADPIVNQIPKVVSVLTFGEQTKARLLLTSGVTRTYEEGDLINARMRIAAVSPREVVVAITPSKPAGKSKGPVLMPLEFIAGARAMQQGPQAMGQPGQVVQNGIIPEGLMQSPPVGRAPGAVGGWPAGQQPPAEPQLKPAVVQPAPQQAAPMPAQAPAAKPQN